jgi:hypothetical protein
MKTKIAVTFAFLFSINAIVNSQSAQAFAAATTKDSDNPTYRVVGKTRYIMLNPAGETHLYQLDPSPSKNKSVVKQYYFSKGMGDIQKLTLANIKNAFAGDLNFQEALDAEFTSDEELIHEESLTRLAALFEMRDEGAFLESENIGQN